MKYSAFSFLILSLFMACTSSNNQSKMPPKKIDVQGHRGARGVLPENSIPGFIYALQAGVSTLELDVVVSHDHQLIVSHEPWMGHEICTDSLGKEIPENEAMHHNIYQMNVAQIQSFDCGSKPHPRFPEQQKQKLFKPTLTAVIDSVEAYISTHGLKQIFYNIETKCLPQGDNIFHPTPDVFSQLLIHVLSEKNILERSFIQTFDSRTLQFIHQNYPEVKTVLLVENENLPEHNLSELGFTPYAYSPNFSLVDSHLTTFCWNKNMKLIPWTVNDTNDIKAMLDRNVDGIISDYPERVLQILQAKNLKTILE